MVVELHSLPRREKNDTMNRLRRAKRAHRYGETTKTKSKWSLELCQFAVWQRQHTHTQKEKRKMKQDTGQKKWIQLKYKGGRRHKQIGETIVITLARFWAQDERQPNEKDRERICALQEEIVTADALSRIWILRVRVFIRHASHTQTACCCCPQPSLLREFFVIMCYALRLFRFLSLSLLAIYPKLLTFVCCSVCWYLQPTLSPHALKTCAQCHNFSLLALHCLPVTIQFSGSSQRNGSSDDESVFPLSLSLSVHSTTAMWR